MTTASSELYSALPLTDLQFRILTIEPGVYGEILRTKLRAGFLLREAGALLLQDTCPVEYQALSYRWESESKSKVEISCNYCDVFIRESAYRALTRLRDVKGPVHVWIDAICINQEDPMEKAVQVPRMRDIYANAKEVIVWLGHGHQNIGDVLYRLAHTPDKATQQYAETCYKISGKPKGLSLRPTSEPKTSTERVQSMQALLELPWFSRVWCKQEIWAARKVLLRYDDIICEWEQFDVEFFENMIASTVTDIESVPGIKRARKHLAQVRDQHVMADSAALASVRDKDVRNPYLREDYKQDIVNVIRRYYGSQCGDQRDRVYGLMGMSSTNKYVHEEDDKRHETLAVSYSEIQSTAKTYEDLARYVIGRDESLSILFLEGVFDRQQPREEFNDQPLPTWVPDWGCKYGTLEWLTSRVATPLSEKAVQPLQTNPRSTATLQPFSGFRFPLLVCGYRIGVFNGETLSPQQSLLPGGLTHTGIEHMKTGLLSMSDWVCQRLNDGPPTALYASAVQDGLWISGMVPWNAQVGDVAIAVHGAYAPLLVRPSTENVRQFTMVGPTILPDDAYPFAHVAKAEACLTQTRSSQFPSASASGKHVTDRLRELLRVLGDKGEKFEII